jgi:hypothetical protein
MTNVAALTVFAAISGLIAGVVVHWNVRNERRHRFQRWSLAFGVFSVAVVCIIVAAGISLVPTRGALGLVFIGPSALVAGLTVLILGSISKGRPGV